MCMISVLILVNILTFIYVYIFIGFRKGADPGMPPLSLMK